MSSSFTFPLLAAVFSGSTMRSKKIDYIRTGHSCEPSVFSESRLASFVSSMVTTLLYTNTNSTSVQPRFTKYVLALFQKTHISCSSILLSLVYCHRLKIRVNTPIELFRLYTTSLILADCFLNDNAFSTQSWYDNI
jgi:hypothetical protein